MPIRQFVEEWEDFSESSNYPFVEKVNMVSSTDNLALPRNFILDANIHIEEDRFEFIYLRSIEVKDAEIILTIDSSLDSYTAAVTKEGPADILDEDLKYVGCLHIGKGLYSLQKVRKRVYTFGNQYNFVPKVINQASIDGIKGIRVGGEILAGDVKLVLDPGWDFQLDSFNIFGNPYYERDTLYKSLAPSVYLGRPVESINGVNNSGQFWFSTDTYDRLRFIVHSSDTIRIVDIKDTERR